MRILLVGLFAISLAGGETHAVGAALNDKVRLCVLRGDGGSVIRLGAAMGQPADFAGGTMLKILDKPWADPKTGLLWVIREGKELVVLDLLHVRPARRSRPGGVRLSSGG